MTFIQALPIILVTAFIIEGISAFVPAVKNLIGVIGPVIVVMGLMGWRLLGSSTYMILLGVAVIVVRYVFLVVMTKD